MLAKEKQPRRTRTSPKPFLSPSSCSWHPSSVGFLASRRLWVQLPHRSQCKRFRSRPYQHHESLNLNYDLKSIQESSLVRCRVVAQVSDTCQLFENPKPHELNIAKQGQHESRRQRQPGVKPADAAAAPLRRRPQAHFLSGLSQQIVFRFEEVTCSLSNESNSFRMASCNCTAADYAGHILSCHALPWFGCCAVGLRWCGRQEVAWVAHFGFTLFFH